MCLVIRGNEPLCFHVNLGCSRTCYTLLGLHPHQSHPCLSSSLNLFGCTCACLFRKLPARCQMFSSPSLCFSCLHFLSPSSSSPLYWWLLELSGGLSDANWWVNRSGVSAPPPSPRPGCAQTHTHRHAQIHGPLEPLAGPNGWHCLPAISRWALVCALVAQAAVQAQRGFIHSLTHSYEYRHTQAPCVPCTPATRFHTPDSRTAGEHTHTKEQTDAVTLEMQAKRCRGEKFSLKLENSLFISAFGLQEEFCLFVRIFFVKSL